MNKHILWTSFLGSYHNPGLNLEKSSISAPVSVLTPPPISSSHFPKKNRQYRFRHIQQFFKCLSGLLHFVPVLAHGIAGNAQVSFDFLYGYATANLNDQLLEEVDIESGVGHIKGKVLKYGIKSQGFHNLKNQPKPGIILWCYCYLTMNKSENL